MRHPFPFALSALVVASAAATLAPTDARAQGTVQGNWSTGTGPQGWTTGPAQPAPFMAPPSSGTQSASDLEIGTLYGFSAGYGVGTGIWIDAELNIDDPGLKFMAPAILGLAAPVGVFFFDRPRMPRGMPPRSQRAWPSARRRRRDRQLPVRALPSRTTTGAFAAFRAPVFIGSTAWHACSATSPR